MARITQPVDLHSCKVETVFTQLVSFEEHPRHVLLLGNDNDMYYVYPVIFFSDGKIPFPIEEQSPGLNKLTSILSRLEAQDLCNTKNKWEKVGLLLNVDDSISRRNLEAPQFYNMQGFEIDEERPGFECAIKYLRDFPPEMIAMINQITWNTLRRYFVLDPSTMDEDHVGSDIVTFQRIKIRIQKFIENSSETIAINTMKTLERDITSYSEYSAIRSDLALYISLYKRSAGIPFGSINQQMSDEWVRIQTTKIKIFPDLYVNGLKTTFLSAFRGLLCGKGILLSELMNSIEYVYKKGLLSKPSLFDTVEGINSSELAETIRRKRLEEQHASWYPYNLVAYRTKR